MTDETAAADYGAFLDHLEGLLTGPARAEIRSSLGAGDLPTRLKRLRRAMNEHTLEGTPPGMAKVVRRLDVRTRKDGFHCLNSWDHQTHRFTEDITPVLLLDFFVRTKVQDPDADFTVALLVDYYFLHLLALAAMRVWDSDDPGAAMGRVTRLLEKLQGEAGSGHNFLSRAESLLIYAISQFHPEEQAYGRVIDRVSTLPPQHRTDFAISSAAVLGAHLRWGFWLMYERDVVRMRRDNEGDYPWLLWTAETLLEAWRERFGDTAGTAASAEVEAAEGADADSGAADRGDGERDRLLIGLLQVLAPDPWLLTGSVPASLPDLADRHSAVRDALKELGPALLAKLEAHRPTKERYSPLSLHFNFPHNALVAAVTLSLMESTPAPLPLDVLFEAPAAEDGGVAQEHFARVLMAFSGGSLDRLGHRGAMLIAYDPLSGMRSYSMMTRTLSKAFGTD